MKVVVLSADGPRYVYSVPNIVAENLEKYCNEFCCEWLLNSPDAKKYRKKGGLHYDQEAFIAYLNEHIFPNKPSMLIEKLGWINFGDPLPEKYKDAMEFNF